MEYMINSKIRRVQLDASLFKAVSLSVVIVIMFTCFILVNLSLCQHASRSQIGGRIIVQERRSLLIEGFLIHRRPLTIPDHGLHTNAWYAVHKKVKPCRTGRIDIPARWTHHAQFAPI